MHAAPFTHLVNRHDARVIEMGRGFRFNAKTVNIVSGRELPGANDLECHDAIEADLPGLVNQPHATLGYFANELVIAKYALASRCKRVERLDVKDTGVALFARRRRLKF